VIHRIRGWFKRGNSPSSSEEDVIPMELKGRFYATAVRLTMLCGRMLNLIKKKHVKRMSVT